MLTKFYRTESAVDFDAYKTIFIHSFSFVMFVFFIIVFWFFVDFVKITIFFEIEWWSTCYKNDDETCCRCIQKLNSFKIMTCCRTLRNLSYQSYLKIFVWWFWYDLFQLTKEIKATRNDKTKIIIADYTHAWIKIRTTYNWYNRTEWIFVECKIEKNVWMNTNSFIQEVLSVMFQ